MVEANSDNYAKLAAIGMQPDTITNTLKNKKVTAALLDILERSEISSCSKEKGALFNALATKLKPVHEPYRTALAKYIADEKWLKSDQLTEGIKFIDAKIASEGKSYQINFDELDAETGVGVVITEAQIDAAVNEMFEENAAAIEEQKHDFNFGKLLSTVSKKLKWADGAMVRDKVNAKKTSLIGEPPATDGKRKKHGKAKN